MSKYKYYLFCFYIKSSFAFPVKDDFPHWIVNGSDELNAIVFNANQFLSSNGILEFNSYFVKLVNAKNKNSRVNFKKMSGCSFSNGENIPDSNIFLLVNSKEYLEYQYLSVTDFNYGDNGAEISVRIKGLSNNHYGTFSCRVNASLIYIE
ncbi:hypothetical protein [Fluviispira multicolorata]|uniref:Uncharacterized protein n=1 Tax=Fluviispira multicolorata TaxID=2654512 RepID=A0A833JE59_9BACT|nr:hypothetical protein [Fluviispira multicolorata]KAB8032174.1 hypothetical protein GCL57_05885 [Fluviispira multicolorata]